MGTISINKIGGLALILGPVVALVFYLLQPGGSFIDAADPANAGETINAMVSNATLGKVVSIIVPIGLIVFLFGILVLQGDHLYFYRFHSLQLLQIIYLDVQNIDLLFSIYALYKHILR